MGRRTDARNSRKTEAKPLPKDATRLGIFECHDKDGIIDDYIPYLLNDMMENLTDLVVVFNGKLTPEGRRRLLEITPQVFVRADEGFDAAAWKEAMIDYLGWEKVSQYDELVLFNDTFFGPLYPFREVFAEMDSRPADFWGLTAHDEANDPFGTSPYGYWPQHIQSYFLAIRKPMHTSYEFHHYWEEQKTFQSFNELVNKNEVVFTKHFEDAGFQWQVYVDMSDIKSSRNTALNYYAYYQDDLIKNHRFPILKRRNFSLPYKDVLSIANGAMCRKCIDYVEKETNYDVSMIYQNILRVYNISDIWNNLQLSYILPKDVATFPQPHKGRAVLVFHIGYIDMLDTLKPYLCGLPESVDVIVTTKPEKNKTIVEQALFPSLGKRLRVLVAQDPGRDLSAFLVTAKPCLKDYEYIGFCHDKKSHGIEPVTIGAGFEENLLENTLASTVYVENILSTMERHSEIGLLVTPPPNHAVYFCLFGNRWTCCFDETKQLAKKLNLHVDISKDKPPLSIGTAFWCRREALKPLLDYPWINSDFPPEPLVVDGTLNHALERIFPYVAQEQGYLTGWVMTRNYAALEITNLQYITDSAATACGKPSSNIYEFEEQINGNRIGVKGALVIYFKKHTPKRLWGVARFFKHLLRW